MSSIFQNLQKYAGKWEVVGQPAKLDADDLKELEPTALIVKSTWGKSFCFTTKAGHYQMFIPADSSVEAQIGSRVPITDITIVTLHKEGENDIQRVLLDD